MSAQPPPHTTAPSPRPAGYSLLRDTDLLRNIAFMAAGGQSIQAIAGHCGLSLLDAKKALQVAHFNGYITDYQKQMSNAELTEKLLRGSAVDSVMVLIKLRDDEQVRPNVRVDICKFLLRECVGQNKLGLLGKDNAEDSMTAEFKRTGDIAAALDTELVRLLTNDPHAKAMLEQRVRDDGFVPSSTLVYHPSPGSSEPSKQSDQPGVSRSVVPAGLVPATSPTKGATAVCVAEPGSLGQLI